MSDHDCYRCGRSVEHGEHLDALDAVGRLMERDETGELMQSYNDALDLGHARPGERERDAAGLLVICWRCHAWGLEACVA